MAKVSLKNHDLESLKKLLKVIAKKNLFWEEMESCENKWQALTLRNNIIQLIDDKNSEYVKELDEINKMLKKFNDEIKTFYAEIEELKDEKETPESKKEKVKEKLKFENDLNERRVKAIEKMGLKMSIFQFPQQLIFIEDKENNPKNLPIEIELNDDFKQLAFIKEQMEKNIYKMPISDDILARLAEAFMF